MAGTWLEARSCERTAKRLDRDTVLRFPALAEAMKVAQDAQAKGGYWEYSIKLEEAEAKEMGVLFAGATTQDDGRSERRTIDVTYGGKCYSLTLFVFKE
jgi:hypothetical protein